MRAFLDVKSKGNEPLTVDALQDRPILEVALLDNERDKISIHPCADVHALTFVAHNTGLTF
jgi:hypothetical protein